MNRYRKGANVEREAVNRHIKDGAVFAGRFAGSKCKGKLKVDVVALYYRKGIGSVLYLEQYKKGKQSTKKEELKFMRVQLPYNVNIARNFVKVK